MFENPNETIGGGITALMVACNQGNVALAEDLINRGADADVRVRCLKAINFARAAGHHKIVDLLEFA